MFKITAIVSLILIGNLLAAGLSCNSCGSECASACGTRHFRSCCFNYLRKKRGPDANNIKLIPQYVRDMKAPKRIQRPTLPMIVVEETPKQWWKEIISSDFEPYVFDGTVDHRLQALYDV
ncbi:unnamed protein product [Parnassius mnemosyne]|uniref:Trissin n=1 Tax=Parnassius mnemosyne TaxID=213953 RepID=A0AAV1L088_9NEOP